MQSKLLHLEEQKLGGLIGRLQPPPTTAATAVHPAGTPKHLRESALLAPQRRICACIKYFINMGSYFYVLFWFLFYSVNNNTRCRMPFHSIHCDFYSFGAFMAWFYLTNPQWSIEVLFLVVYYHNSHGQKDLFFLPKIWLVFLFIRLLITVFEVSSWTYISWQKLTWIWCPLWVLQALLSISYVSTYLYFFKIEMQLTYNIMLVSSEQHNDSIFVLLRADRCNKPS